ncbi:MAG: 3'(2'),5'-bisphosphate nucleotidase CysQ [Sphingomonadaceae bacterium]
MTMLDKMVEAALEAGAAVDRIYREGCEAEIKEDGSPVTEADHAAEEIILKHLRGAYPDIAVLAEEEAAEGKIPELGPRFFLVDPLDGTKSFLKRSGEFTVNIALVENGVPTHGVVQAPALDALYAGAKGEGAWRRLGDHPSEPIATPDIPEARRIAVGSRDHHMPGTEEKLAELKVGEFIRAGSSLKFCRVAEGAAHVYPRFGPTMEWDTAAGQAVLEAAGGRVLALDGMKEAGPLTYGKREAGYRNPHFIAWGR